MRASELADSFAKYGCQSSEKSIHNEWNTCTCIAQCCYNTVNFLQNPHKRHPSTHWGRVTHICVIKLTIIGSDNGLSPGRRQTIIWTNAGILLIGPLGTNFSEILIKILVFSFKKMHLKMSSGKWRPSCLGLNVLNCPFGQGMGCILCLQTLICILPQSLQWYMQYSVLPIYRGGVYRGIGYIAVACWTPFFGAQERNIFHQNRGNSLTPIWGRQFFVKCAHRDSLCSLFAGDNFLRNQL